MNMKDTLDLCGADDGVELVHDVERTFGIALSDDEAERTITVGQLYDLIETKQPNAGSRTSTCLSQTAFYRLRRAVKSMGVTGKITPQTPIAVLGELEPFSVSQKWRQLAEGSDLYLPPLETHSRLFEAWPRVFCSASGWWLWGLLICAWAALAIYMVSPAVLASGIITVPALYGAIHYVLWLVFRTVTQRLITIGDLAREAAGCSFIKLSAEKKGCGPSDRWLALTAMLRAHAGHQSAITRQTTFFAEHAKPAA
jgi:hypothetical protein